MKWWIWTKGFWYWVIHIVKKVIARAIMLAGCSTCQLGSRLLERNIEGIDDVTYVLLAAE